MGEVPESIVTKVGWYLLKLLDQKGRVDYSYFYDGSEERSHWLCDQAGLDEDEKLRNCVEHAMDVAIHELEDQSMVEVEQLEDVLADGEPNLRITIKKRGKNAAKGKTKVEFWSAE